MLHHRPFRVWLSSVGKIIVETHSNNQYNCHIWYTETWLLNGVSVSFQAFNEQMHILTSRGQYKKP